jgi:hypothetical protein
VDAAVINRVQISSARNMYLPWKRDRAEAVKIYITAGG